MRNMTFVIFLVFILLAGCASMESISKADAPADKTPASTELKKLEAREEIKMDSSSRADISTAKSEPAMEAATAYKPGKIKKAKKSATGIPRESYDKSFSPSYSMKSPTRAPRSSVSGLKAALSDDNKQFNYFLSFQQKYAGQIARFYPVKVDERIILKVRDNVGKPLANAEVRILDNDRELCSGKTYADGSFLFFPTEYAAGITSYRAVVDHGQTTKEVRIDRQGPREIAVAIDTQRGVIRNIPLDILFVLDTTGSMGAEIERLKNTIEIINMNLAALPTKPDIRFGMVQYRDKTDEYVTKIIDFTEDLEKFHGELNKVTAGGGGDTPEDMQSALLDSMRKMKWNSSGIRLAYLITDAPPHLDYGQEYTYVDAMHDARKQGIKIFSVGTGSLNLMGEYILRQISQYSYAKYIFLTHGETGESEGGKPGSVSHHTGSNYQTDKLESIIIRLAKEELSFQSEQPLPEDDSYFSAVKNSDEQNDDVLRKLFDMSITQLVDYATIGIDSGTPVSLVPFQTENAALKANAEYFTSQMLLSLTTNKRFKLVERSDMQKLMEELKLQKSGIIDEEKAVRLGKLIGAKILITGKLHTRQGNYEAFIKMLRVETGEVLSVTKLKIDSKLGTGMN